MPPPERRITPKREWTLLPEKEKGIKKKKIKVIKKGREFALRPTAFQLAEGIGLLGGKPLSKITGFEIER